MLPEPGYFTKLGLSVRNAGKVQKTVKYKSKNVKQSHLGPHRIPHVQDISLQDRQATKCRLQFTSSPVSKSL